MRSRSPPANTQGRPRAKPAIVHRPWIAVQVVVVVVAEAEGWVTSLGCYRPVTGQFTEAPRSPKESTNVFGARDVSLSGFVASTS